MADKPRAPSVLWSVAPLLQRGVDLDQLLEELVRRVAAALDADRGTIYLVEPGSGDLVSRAAVLPEIREIRLRPGQGVAGQAAQAGATVNLPQAARDRHFFRDIDRQTGYRTESLLATPICERGGRLLGVVQVLNARRGRFDEEDEASLRQLAAELALAIEHTSLLSATVEPAATPGRRAAQTPPPHRRFNGIIGSGAAMREVYARLARAAATTATVLVRGESGTGKELIAQALHVNSARRTGPFVKVDCASIPASLMENELFGHERGAYTGAAARAPGRCEQAEGGTLFLDEIGELPLSLQPKLLRFVQDRQFERVGGGKTLTADVRVVAATHRDLEAMVGRGDFRADLYYRIKVVQVALPPLRERGTADILQLAEHFADLFGRRHRGRPLVLSPEARAALLAHNWPGNIRELQNCIEAAVVLCEGEVIEPAHLPLAAAVRGAAPADEPFVTESLAALERRHILRTLAAVDGNHSRAAALLGIGRNTLYRKLRQYG